MSTSTYAIVGSGNIGSALARLFARAGIEVSITNTRGPESIREFAASLGSGVHAVTLADALKSEVILMAIPFGAVAEFGKVMPDWNGMTVVDTTNAHYTPGVDQLLNGRPASEYVTANLPGADVVKAFNQLPSAVLAAELDPAVGKRVIFVASDSAEASHRIAQLVTDLGLSAVELGPVDEGGRLIEAPNALVLRNLIEPPLP